MAATGRVEPKVMVAWVKAMLTWKSSLRRAFCSEAVLAFSQRAYSSRIGPACASKAGSSAGRVAGAGSSV